MSSSTAVTRFAQWLSRWRAAASGDAIMHPREVHTDPLRRGAPWQATHRHRKGGEYRVLALCTLEADRREGVIYDDRDGTIWVRPKSEFCDGRFTPLNGGGNMLL